MANLVEYVISFRDKFTQPMQRVQRQARSFNTSINNVTSSASKASGSVGVMSGAVGMLGKMFAGLAVMAGVKKVAQWGMEMEQTRVRFETFTGSVEKGNAVIAELQKFAIATPFEDSQVLKAGQSLLAFGVEAEKLNPILSTLGNISSATGKDFNELVTIYGKNKLSGIIQAEDLNQLTEAGIPVYESLAKQMGVTTDQVKKMGSEGKISFGMLEKTFDELGGKQGKWGDLMDKQSQTFGGRLSSLMGIVQNMGGQLGEMINPFLGKLVEAGITLMYFINDNKKTLGQMFQPLQEAFQPLMDAFSEVLEMMGITSDSGSFLKSVFNGIATVIKFLSPFIKGLAEVLGHVVVSIFKVIKAIKEWYEKTAWIQKIVQFLYVSITTVFDALVEKAKKTFGGIASIIEGVFSADLGMIKDGIKSFTDGMLPNAMKEGMSIGEKIAEGMKQPFGGVNLFNDTYTSLAAEASNGGTTGSTAKTGMGTKADENTNTKLSSAIGSATGSKSNTYNITITKLIESYTNQFTNVQESKEVMKNMVLQALTGAVSDLTTNLN